MKWFRKGREAPESEEGGDQDVGTLEDQLVDVDGEEGSPKVSFVSKLLGKGKPKSPSTDLVEIEDTPKSDGVLSKLKGLFSKNNKADTEEDEEELGKDDTGLEEIRTGRVVDMEFEGGNIVTIGKKKLLMGMLWDSARQGEKIKSQANDLSGSGDRLDLVANFKSANQLGFASTASGVKPGFKAGVTCFNEAKMGRSWIAAFQLVEALEVYWVVGVRNGQVYEDQIVDDRAEAKAVFLDNLQAPDWQRRIAPESWDLGGTTHYRFQDVVDTSVGISLKPINPFKTYLPRIIAAAVITAAAAAGYIFWQQYQEAQEQAARDLEKQRQASVRVSPQDYPWFDTPELDGFFTLCIPEMEVTIRRIPTWSQGPISCTLDEKRKKASVETSWKNSGGTVPWMMGAFRPDEIQPTINLDGSAAGYKHTLELGVTTDVMDEPWERERIDSILLRRLQTTRAPVSMKAVVKNVTVQEQQKMKKPVFNFHDMTFSTSTGLWEYARLFSDIPAIVPQAITYEPNQKVWSVNFRIYHPAILPM